MKLHRLIIAISSIALTVGCQSLPPGEPVAGADDGLSQPQEGPQPWLVVPEAPPNESPEATASHQDLWVRIRSELSWQNLDDSRINKAQVEAARIRFLRQSNYLPVVANRANYYLYYIVEEVEKRDMPMEIALLPGLAAVTGLPRIEAGSDSWQLVLHLSRLLPMLAAQLLLVFQKYGVVDHSQVAQSALLALGEDDTPTDLALRLDYQIEHILVDEFQDTAVNQYELLHKLTRGWGDYNAAHPEAPRTLLIVGDGMQSIYSFRGANVGLFLKAQQEGFNGVELSYLRLRCNFRSDAGVVDWVNATFEPAFPAHSDVQRAQVSYSPATAVRPAGKNVAANLQAFCGEDAREQEVEFVCRYIAEHASQDGTIAVLGRSRGHLQPIITGLKALDIPYNAQDLDSLAHSPVVADMLTLCRVLANDADRLAWMSILRAPWCGLQLADLLAVATLGEDPRYTSLWEVLQEAPAQGILSEEGRQRLQHVAGALFQAASKRDRLGLRVWIEQTWIGLGGPECAADANALQDAESFLQLLEQAEAEGLGLDIEWLTRRLEKQYMSGGDPHSSVQLMTLHKAKGLEFERVIIPQLDRKTRGDDRAILLWDEHSSVEGERSFLLAADDHSDKDAPTLYNYLRSQRKQKTLLETTRLLYVGATRAVSHLLLTALVKWDEKKDVARAPAGQSLLSPIWPTFEQQMTVQHSIVVERPVEPSSTGLLLTRLRSGAVVPERPLADSHITEPDGNMPVRADNHTERSIGTVVHLALEQLSLCPVLPESPSERDKLRWKLALQREGLWGDVLERALAAVLDSVAVSLGEGGAGRWVLSPEHPGAHSEWALTGIGTEGRIQDIVIDRSFIDAQTGVRWIVDYKNSQPAEGESQADFAARESAVYREQLQCYRDALHRLNVEPLRCALYFSAIGLLHPIDELDLTPPGAQG